MANILPQTSRVASSEPLTMIAPPFEKQLGADFNAAMSEASLFFEGRGKVQQTYDKITRRLEELQVEHAVCGGMAVSAHGYWRFTDDVDILVNLAGLSLIHERLDGLGFIRPFSQSKNLRDVETGVRIEFLIAGQFPGDGKPKAIAFPEPSQAFELVNGKRVLTLAKLVELKLASGLSGAGREKDFGDVQELIKALRLPEAFVGNLHPDVQAKFTSLWQSSVGQKYLLGLPRDSSQPLDTSLADLLQATLADRQEVDALLAAGLVFDAELSRSEYSVLSTTDAALAERFGMVPQHDFMFLPRTKD